MNDNEQAFLEQIQKNLTTNGFPSKKVTLPLEKLYEVADQKEANLNTVLDHLEKEFLIHHEKTGDKIIFSSSSKLNPDMMKKADEMMKNMGPEQLAEIQKKVMNMSEEERNEMMKQAKQMGIF